MSRNPRLILLGSTGSIGTATLQVVDHLRATAGRHYDVVGLAAGSNSALAASQAHQYGVTHVALSHAKDAVALPPGVRAFTGPDAALELIHAVAQPGDMVMGAIVGSAGLAPTLAAIERGCDIAIANKETLVAAGQLVMPAVKRAGVRLIPVDSEHSAVLQCMRAGAPREVRRVVLTASGGPFRTWSAERTASATLQEALKHPTWVMGQKVTIDSASLMNKALEVIEAHWLFDLSADRIDAIMHPQSVVHSFVEFTDGSVMAQLSPPSMKLPIQYALDLEERSPGCSPPLDWSKLQQLEFQAIDPRKFPAIELARRVIRAGGTSGAIFNAANEAAVCAFVAGQIPFGQISTLVAAALDALPSTPVLDLPCVMRADAASRAFVNEHVGVGSA
jgi:1-deoxy-D-xylulose-5-phosphate reductoisomerase